MTVTFRASYASTFRQFRLRDRASRSRRLSVPQVCSTDPPPPREQAVELFLSTPRGCPRDAGA